MSIHRIRLQGPWEYQWLSDAGNSSLETSAGKLQMPASWQDVFGSAPGTAQFTRRFHAPTNLESHEQVHLVFDGVAGRGDVLLNDEQLGQLATSSTVNSFDITALLQPANVLKVIWTCSAECDFNRPAGLYAPVVLEIHDDSLLVETE